jgi:hypothetical protein
MKESPVEKAYFAVKAFYPALCVGAGYSGFDLEFI